MPHFFFDSQDGTGVHDDRGMELPSPAAAIDHAIDTVTALAQTHRPRDDNMEFACVVRTEEEEVIYTALLVFVGRSGGLVS
ncbi:DUF6894 family protein [Roseococcus sp.]|uniref:DUF6894 family protein n=1 Tax=Roseococcus sp. TaxID=2109646 RepID=UPI003BAD4E5B